MSVGHGGDVGTLRLSTVMCTAMCEQRSAWRLHDLIAALVLDPMAAIVPRRKRRR